MNVGIVCACLPSLKPFARHAFPNAFERLSRRLHLEHGTVTRVSLPTMYHVGHQRNREAAFETTGTFLSTPANTSTPSSDGSIQSNKDTKSGSITSKSYMSEP